MIKYISLFGLLICVCAAQMPQNIRLATFKRVSKTSYTANPIDNPWSEPTLLACIRKCSSLREPCTSVIYNIQSRACTRGSTLTHQTVAHVTQTEDRLYYNTFCNRKYNVSVYIYRTLVLCLFISTEPATFSMAKTKCLGKDSRMFVVNSLEKLELLRYIAQYITRDMTWIGLNDEDQEKVFVWADGNLAQNASYPLPWRFGQPDDKHHSENCVEIGSANDFERFNDQNCNKEAQYICEMDSN